jgi:hypothetical protein
MDAAEPPYTTEEETLADQFVKNASLVTECTRHPSQFYQARSRRDTLERIDRHLEKGERLLTLIKRDELHKRALIAIVLRKYLEKCPLCKNH